MIARAWHGFAPTSNSSRHAAYLQQSAHRSVAGVERGLHGVATLGMVRPSESGSAPLAGACRESR